ncbi:MAG: hypothetical protein EXR99_13720 [Gemmataceae bacterium]|nr:hypothetical protein [Gemmataceae bacterium]
MDRPVSSSRLNLARNILLVIGLFNICFYSFVLKSVDQTPKTLAEQNKQMEEGKRLTETELQARGAELVILWKKNSWVSIAAGVGIVLLAFLIPLSPGLITLVALGGFSASLAYQFFLGSQVLLEGLVIKVACVFGFFQAVRFAVQDELEKQPELPALPKSDGIQFPKPDPDPPG